MRNLKKILALVLALMMVLSVMVTASAAFEDDADIAHKDAVDVMVAAGILSGDGNGNFRPADALERSAAAKLIAYLLLGESIEYVDQTETVFADVPATHWASGYVAYANEQGIVVGNNGNFDPNGSINGYSFAKMVLLALVNLGETDMATVDSTAKVGNDGEWKVAPLTGNYTLKVRLAIAALKDQGIDLLAGLEDISLNANLTREHAAQMVFNALNDTEILKDTYKLTKAPYGEAGLSGYVWTTVDAEGKTVNATAPVVTDTLVASFPAGTTYANVMKALGVTDKSTVKGQNYYNTAVWGGEFACADWVKSTATVPATYTLDVYKSGTSYKFMYTVETLATAAVAKDAETTGANKGLYKWIFGTAVTYAAKDAYTDKGVYVVVANGTELLSATAATKVTGKILGMGAGHVYVNNTTYTVLDGVSIPPMSVTAEYDLYLATDGTVLSITVKDSAPGVVDAAETLVYILGIYSVEVPAVDPIPAKYNEYGEEIEEAVAGKDAYYNVFAQTIDMDGNIVNYLTAEFKAAVTNWTERGLCAVTIDEDGFASFATPTKSNVLTTSKITEKDSVKFVKGGKNYYYSSAEYVVITGYGSKVTMGVGSRKAAAAADHVVVFYDGDPTKTNNLTVTKILYWVDFPAGGTPAVDPEVQDGMFAQQSVSKDAVLIEVEGEDGEITYKTVYSHNFIIDGKETTIWTAENELNVEGPATYKVDEYGVVYDIKAAASIKSELVNVYENLYTFEGTEFEDVDISNATIIDVSGEDANGVLDLNESVIIVTEKNAEGKDVISVIYITGSVKAEE